MTIRFSRIAGLATIILLWVTSATAATTYRYTIFDVPGSPTSLAFGINGSGEIVGGTGKLGYIDSAGVFTGIEFPGARATHVYSINDLGQYVGFYNDGKTFRGFLRSKDTYKAVIADGANTTFCFGINNSGHIVGTYNTSEGEYGFEYENGNFSMISVPGALIAKTSGTQAHGINNVGQIVGFYNVGVEPVTGRKKVNGFIDTGGTIKTFSVPGAYATEADGINDSGDIVGTFGTDSGGYGFVYSRGVFTTLAVPEASKTEAQGINNAGQVVGWVELNKKLHGFIATPVP